MRVCDSCLDACEDDAVICFGCLTTLKPETTFGGTDEELHRALKEDIVRTKYSVTTAEIFGHERHTGKDE